MYIYTYFQTSFPITDRKTTSGSLFPSIASCSLDPRLLSYAAEGQTPTHSLLGAQMFPLISLDGPYSGFQHFLWACCTNQESDYAFQGPLPPSSACAVNYSHLIVLRLSEMLVPLLSGTDDVS